MPRRSTTLTDYQARILRAQQLLETRLEQPIDPAALAGAASFSLHHFHRIFRAQMGESVMQHVRRLRLERAARKLRGGERLLELAIEAGYESHEAFTRAFIAQFGLPPSEYRERTPTRTPSRAPETSAISVKVRSCEARRVAFMRHRGSYSAVHHTWNELVVWAEAQGLLDHTPRLYGICPDDPEVTAEPLLRFDACVSVPEEFRVSAGAPVGIVEIGAGSYAVGVHRGSYTRLSDTYLDIIGRWFPTSGYEPAADAVIEHYLNNPSTAAEADLLTEVRVRIAD